MPSLPALSRYERAFAIEPLGRGMIEEKNILRAEAERCKRELLDEVDRIEKAASIHRATLEDQIKVLQDRIIWSSKVQEAEEEVCFIRLKREFEMVKREVLGEETIVGPIQTLPTELLIEIFRYYVDSNGSPWILVKVCLEWKHVATMAPHLWYHIMVTDDRRPIYPSLVVDGAIQYCPGNTQVCYDTTQLLASIHRSGVLPLNIIINCKESGAAFLSLLNTMFNSIPERIRHLKFGCPSFSFSLESGLSVPERLPLLVSIELPVSIGPWVHALLHTVSSTSPEFDNIVCRGELSPELASHSFWHIVKRFTLPKFSNYQLQLNLIAPKLERLERYQYSQFCWPEEDSSVAIWPIIRDISLRSAPRHLQLLKMPQLATLRLKDWLGIDLDWQDPEKKQEALEISFPMLTKLELNTLDPSWLSGAHLPRITELSISYDSYIGTHTSPFIQNTFPTVEILTLRVWWDDRATLRVLSAFPKLRSLKISDSDFHPDFGVVLLGGLTSNPQSGLCPSLERIWLGEPEIRVHTPTKEVFPLITRLLDTRRNIGTPLKQLVVSWSGGSQDYA